jgi:hypothetical protein
MRSECVLYANFTSTKTVWTQIIFSKSQKPSFVNFAKDQYKSLSPVRDFNQNPQKNRRFLKKIVKKSQFNLRDKNKNLVDFLISQNC